MRVPSERRGAAEGCAVVTGGSRGIGAAVAEHLRRAGRDVVTLARTSGDYSVDVSRMAEVERVFERVRSERGPVLILVNNAGLRRDGLALRMKEEAWSEVIEVNLTGAFNCTRQVLSGMMRARFGRIVNIASAAASMGSPGQANYAAAKSGLLGFTRSVAREMARKGVTCNAVSPGFIETEMTSDVPDELVGLVPAGRMGTVDEVAACVAFLCSPEASYVNGATLAVDGGLAG